MLARGLRGVPRVNPRDESAIDALLALAALVVAIIAIAAIGVML